MALHRQPFILKLRSFRSGTSSYLYILLRILVYMHRGALSYIAVPLKAVIDL